MTKVKLWCGVYGDGSLFSVDIKRDAYVEALQQAIYAKKRYGDWYKLDASHFRLKNGETTGMKQDVNSKRFLQGDQRVNNEYGEMLSGWRLNKNELFGSSFTPGEEEIHVLVELPLE
ncbi:LOW QUALITY PROTEIN: Crinkler (CRN) [Phytophthora megakarya]|uniref:Crinkler (CRN) n=1 Tax=Phytophthora megakarya TaxID=4795 RepID=A0A225VPD8_9STRA|nr:LOW QUALITY PROTEIN: Crinkler (CRN) [Phytophthora megakarya]